MNFEPMNFIYNLPYLFMGWFGTFLALGLIALSVIILNRFSEGNNK